MFFALTCSERFEATMPPHAVVRLTRSREWDCGAPRLYGGRLLLLAIGLFATLVAGLEGCWRGQGHRPNVPETPALWYFWRQQVYSTDGKVIVLAGTSRMSACISLDTMRTCLPGYKVVQLGLFGPISCIGLLQDLVDDSTFCGIVICELDTPLLHRSEWNGHQRFRTYIPPTIPAIFDAVVKSGLQDRLTVLNERLTLRGLFTATLNVKRRENPVRLRRTFCQDVHWDFGVARDEALEKVMGPASTTAVLHASERWTTIAQDVAEINAMVRRLRMRGGDVVFLRAPSSGTQWAFEQASYPRIDGWDQFSRLTTAVCIHFRDVPEMRALVCPDGSHLDYRDSSDFTRALVSHMRL
jgi:hypothetical protein